MWRGSRRESFVSRERWCFYDKIDHHLTSIPSLTLNGAWKPSGSP
jgi:hypothetical protein